MTTHPEIQIENWRADERNTRRGFFNIALPRYGLVIRDCALHLSHGRWWAAFPAREYTNRDGEKKWWAFVAFSDRDKGDKFQAAVIARLREVAPAAFAEDPAATGSQGTAPRARSNNAYSGPGRSSQRARDAGYAAQKTADASPGSRGSGAPLDDAIPF